MITNCPYCGYKLPRELKDGLSHCSHCNQVFESSDFNKLLAAGWQVRREKLTFDMTKWQLKLDDDFAILVHTFVGDYGYTHEDFMHLLVKLGVSKKSYQSI